MAADAKWWLVCYDVRDAKRLRRTAKHLEGYGHRMQYSVFRCWLTERQMQQLRWELTEILESEDDVLMIPLCSRCVDNLESTHSATKQVDWPDAPASHTIV
jgi:CRISPR-associated protein Cas2